MANGDCMKAVRQATEYCRPRVVAASRSAGLMKSSRVAVSSKGNVWTRRFRSQRSLQIMSRVYEEWLCHAVISHGMDEAPYFLPPHTAVTARIHSL